MITFLRYRHRKHAYIFICGCFLLLSCSHKTEQPCNNHYLQGINYALDMQYEKSIAEYKIAIKEDPHNANAWAGMASAYQLMGNYTAAIESSSKAIGIDGNFAMAYYHRGAALVHIGEHEKALDDFKKLVALKPDFVMGYYECANQEYNLGNYEESEAN